MGRGTGGEWDGGEGYIVADVLLGLGGGLGAE